MGFFSGKPSYYIVSKDGDELKVYCRDKNGYSTEDEAMSDIINKLQGNFAIVVNAKNILEAKKQGEKRLYGKPLGIDTWEK